MKKHVLKLFLVGGIMILAPTMAFANAPSAASNAVVASDDASTCSGLVTDDTGEPLMGATVMIKGTQKGTFTDLDGKFSLSDVEKGSQITVRYIGCKSQTVVWSGKPLTIKLKPEENALDEIVVIGFGSQRKADITDAVSTVDTKMLESRPVTNLSQSLQGTVPGLNLSVGGSGGQLGQSLGVNIRGTGTISSGSSASTLVLIDGIEGNMNNLNPDDVESISVLKDAAASSIYGSRAAFGVILITTKKGKAGQTRVAYSGNARYYGPIKLPTLLDSWNFANLFNDASVNAGSSVIFNQNTLDRIQQYMRGEITTTTIPNNGNGNWQFHEQANDNVNWYDIHYKNSFAQEHNLNLSGGTDKNQYYVSASYLGMDGNLRYGNDRYDRFTASAKINANPYPWLTMEVNTKFMNTDLDNPLYIDLGGLLYHDIIRMWPMMPFKDPNGHYMRNGKLAQLTSGSRSKTNNNEFYLLGSLIFHPLKNWNIYATTAGRFVYGLNNQNLSKVYEYNVNNDPLLLAYGGSYASGATGAWESLSRTRHLNTSVYTDYNLTIDEHQAKLMVGMNAEDFYYRNAAINRMDLITESVPEVGGATGTDKIVGAGAYSWSTAGFFGRLNYDYGNRYFLVGNLRYDGSSRFQAKDRWAWFGSFSLGWNIASEEFFPLKDGGLMTQLKPRFSYGTLGNQNTNSIYPMYLTQTVKPGAGTWLMDGTKPTVATAPGVVSASLTWETVKSTNIGADISMLNGRLMGTFDYFIRKTLNMLGPASEIASIFGISMPPSNNTDLTTCGWEAQLTWRDVIGDFNYSAGFNISDTRTRIDRYPNASKSLSTYYEGEELGLIWGYESVGIAKSNDEMSTWISNNKPSWGSGWGEGDIMYKDQNGDKIINNGASTLGDHGDLIVLGNSTPRFRYGINVDMQWKGFDFSMFWQGVAKRDLWLDGPMFWGVSGGEWQSTGLIGHEDYYRPADTSSLLGANTDAYYPKPYMNKDMNQKVQSRYIQNGAYIRLKNIQLGYSLPASLLSKIHIQNIRVYVSAENLLTFHHLPNGWDPETAYSDYTGNNSGKTYPLQKTVSLGLNVNF